IILLSKCGIVGKITGINVTFAGAAWGSALIHMTRDYTAGTTRLGKFVLLTGIVLVATNLRAPITSVGPVVPQIQDALRLSNTLAGLITTIPLLAFALLSPIAPKLAEKW